jgi:hypothetical protein
MVERLKPLRGEGAKLLKLVTESQDLQTLEQALELGSALGQPAGGLLDGVEVNGAGELVFSSRFRGTQSTQPVFDALLIHQLSLALDGTPEAALRRAVRRLDLACFALPHLRGFDHLESLAITLLPGTVWTDLSHWGSMPSLRALSLTAAGTKEQPASLASLAGLKAPSLEVARLRQLGLTSIEALSESAFLRQVELADNPGISSIHALADSAACLESLDLEGCKGVSDLSSLKGSKALKNLKLKDCARVPSLEPLSASRALDTIDLEGCAHLTSLEGLASETLNPPSYRGFSLKGCAALTSLRGLPRLSDSTSTLYLEEMPALVSLEGIEAAAAIEMLAIESTSVENLNGLAPLKALTEVRVTDCKDLTDVRALGALSDLARASLFNCSNLKQLPAAWGQALRHLDITAGAFTSIGQLPAGLEELEVRGVASLKNLVGIETAVSLRVVAVDTFLEDTRAIQGLPQAHLRCFQADVKPIRPLTAAWIRSVVDAAKPLRLDLRFTSLKELQFLVDLPHLQSVQVSHVASEFYQLKVHELLTEAAVRTFLRAVCKRHQIPVPDFLKPRRMSSKVLGEGGLSLAEVKKGLTSTDFSTIVAMLATLREKASASLYDAVLEGMDAPTLYSGATESLGKLFKDTRAPYRPWVRWILTQVLLDAPESAVRATAARNAITSITLAVDLSHGQDPTKPPPLARFTALESITLENIQGNDLSFLREAGSLKSITLRDMPDLISLESLATMPSLAALKSLHLERCAALVSLKGLEGAKALTRCMASECEALCDFSAMAGMDSLQRFPGRTYGVDRIDLSAFQALKDIGFLSGLKAVTAIELKLTGRIDLLPLAGLPQLQSVKLELDTLDQDFSPLAGQRELSIFLIDPETGYSKSPTAKNQPGQKYVWSGEFLQLEKLEVSGGEHDISQMQAPRLTTFQSWSRMPTLHGVGHASQIKFLMAYCDSLDGLEGSPIESLDIHYNPRDTESLPSVQVLHQLPQLKFLGIGSALTDRHAKELVGCAQVQHLQTSSYSGSLAFLAGWDSLRRLDLRNSGELSDLETLCGLPSLVEIRLRGSAMKRDTWPKALQDRLDFMSS